MYDLFLNFIDYPVFSLLSQAKNIDIDHDMRFFWYDVTVCFTMTYNAKIFYVFVIFENKSIAESALIGNILAK